MILWYMCIYSELFFPQVQNIKDVGYCRYLSRGFLEWVFLYELYTVSHDSIIVKACIWWVSLKVKIIQVQADAYERKCVRHKFTFFAMFYSCEISSINYPLPAFTVSLPLWRKVLWAKAGPRDYSDQNGKWGSHHKSVLEREPEALNTDGPGEEFHFLIFSLNCYASLFFLIFP